MWNSHEVIPSASLSTRKASPVSTACHWDSQINKVLDPITLVEENPNKNQTPTELAEIEMESMSSVETMTKLDFF